MSDTQALDRPDDKDDAVSVDDLRRMLDESRSKFTELERERDEERNRRSAAERERDEATTARLSDAERTYNAEIQAADSGLVAAQSAIDKAQADYAAAMESGDFKTAAGLQVEIAKATNRYSLAEQKKSYLETNKERFVKPEAPKRAGRYSDLIAGELLDSEEKWLDQRPTFRSDETYRSEVLAMSQAAGARYKRGTPEYFRRMEELLGEGQPDPTPKRERAPSADLSAGGRRAPGAPAGGVVEVSLSADEREMADMMYGDSSNAISYIADPGDRYKHYRDVHNRLKSQGRLG